ncbi:MAG TPA: HAMP domain-containing protein, partial [Thermoanaerobaculia bacterium]|nr:HAMP domain-containing protein [Thermoanaerobaculia bacterium]
MSVFARVRRAVDPRRSFGARLLLGFSLTFLILGAIAVLLLSRKLTDLQDQSVQRFSEVRRSEAPARLRQGAGADAAQEIAPRSYSELRQYLALTFLSLLAAMLAAVFLITRRFTAPIADLVRAAEEIGQGRPVSHLRPPGQDELGRLAVALDRTGHRVERRVETLRRLHLLLRQEFRAAPM